MIPPMPGNAAAATIVVAMSVIDRMLGASNQLPRLSHIGLDQGDMRLAVQPWPSIMDQ